MPEQQKKTFFIFNYLKTKIKILDIDFNQPWWKVITNQKFNLIVGTLGEAIHIVFYTLIIMIIEKVFSDGRFDYVLYTFIGWGIIFFLLMLGRIYSYLLEVQAIHSIHFYAHQKFLQMDSFHNKKHASGKICSKIDRAANAYTDFIDITMSELLQVAVSTVTVLVTVFFYSITLGFIVLAFLTVLIFLSIFISTSIINPQMQSVIETDDKVKSISIENLVQIQRIRNCFATDQMLRRLKHKELLVMKKEGRLWLLYNLSLTGIKYIYLFSVCIITTFIFFKIKSHATTISAGVALILTYIRGTYDLPSIQVPIRNTLIATTKIKDLFRYIKTVCRQKYPVLPDPQKTHLIPAFKNETISINAHNIHFKYNDKTHIFSGHSLNLQISEKQENKLYGIIGPSGIGKSTLFSLLGGQLKPNQGLIKINGINIYNVDDAIRKNLIALQGQIPSNIRGTVRYNLLFGLPSQKIIYDDNTLIEILEKVRLWNFFKAKEKLDTLVNEGGINFSGGQLQRLNFANLYLRAMYYKPLLILIDEPTSSLDSLTANKITEMICSLAKEAVTIVIAHNLKTISNASGILDFSLIKNDQELTFYPTKILQEKSDYYKKLTSEKENNFILTK